MPRKCCPPDFISAVKIFGVMPLLPELQRLYHNWYLCLWPRDCFASLAMTVEIHANQKDRIITSILRQGTMPMVAWSPEIIRLWIVLTAILRIKREWNSAVIAARSYIIFAPIVIIETRFIIDSVAIAAIHWRQSDLPKTWQNSGNISRHIWQKKSSNPEDI